MQSRRIESNRLTSHAVVFDRGDEVASGLTHFAADTGIGAGRVTGVGGFERATLGFFDWESKSYVRIPIEEQVEVLSFDGDISRKEDGSPQVHVHVVVGKRDGSTAGGHLMEGTVRPTMEVIVDESPDRLFRAHDSETGLDLIDPGQG